MLDLSFKLRFMAIWNAAMKEGYSSKDARDLASLEITGQPFHVDANDQQSNHNYNGSGANAAFERPSS